MAVYSSQSVVLTSTVTNTESGRESGSTMTRVDTGALETTEKPTRDSVMTGGRTGSVDTGWFM